MSLSVISGLNGLCLADLTDEYDRRGLDSWSDRRLLGAVGEVVSVPKLAPATSFVLHAPLELLARAGLLDRVKPIARGEARRRVVGLAAQYQAAGEPVHAPRPYRAESVGDAAGALVGAIEGGDLGEVDRLASGLGQVATPRELAGFLAGPLAASLAAAAHSSILLYLLLRFAAAGEVPCTLVRGPARELARNPSWRLRWFEDPSEPSAGGPLSQVLLDVPVLGVPGSDFIFPIMNQAEESGIARRLLAGIVSGPFDVAIARAQLSRVAAWSMLSEPPDHAPYGWSHCLTMPQAVMGLAGLGADPSVALAVAATHVVGFRAAMGRERLVGGFAPEHPGSDDLAGAIADGPDAAAAVAWHHRDLDLVEAELATRASLHHDAHLVKYTLACFDAAQADAAERRLYLAAAASLSGWWAQQPATEEAS